MFIINLDVPEQFANEVCVIAEKRLSSMGKSSSKNEPSDRRSLAIRTESLRVGAAIGSRIMWDQLMETIALPKYQKALDKIFNFNYLKIDWQTLPPVIESAEQSARLYGDQKLVTSDQIFKIIKPARLVTSTPTWRSYLDAYKFDDAEPTYSLLPSDGSESSVWRQGLCDGAKKGIEFAADQFADILSRLTRDYKGMLLYKQLSTQGMINTPKLKNQRTGTVLDGDTLVINKQEYYITNHSRFQKPSKWDAPNIIFTGGLPNLSTPDYIAKPDVLEPIPAPVTQIYVEPVNNNVTTYHEEKGDATVATYPAEDINLVKLHHEGIPASKVFAGFKD